MISKIKINCALLCLIISFFQITCTKETNHAVNSQSASSVDQVVSPNTLVAWYPFNGDVLDHSGHNNNINFNNAKLTKGRHGIKNTAYHFDGSNSYMTIPNSTSLNPNKITLIASIRPAAFYQGLCHRNTILYKANDDNTPGKYLLAFDDMAYYNFDGCNEPVQNNFQNFYGSYGDGQATAAGARDSGNYISTYKWYVVVFTYDGIYAKLYINGILTLTNKVTTTFTANQVPIYIGKSLNAQYPYNFKGDIDEIRIYSSALSLSQIRTITHSIESK
jgi:hypothetical protein